MAVFLYQPFVEPILEIVTVDKWLYQWGDPVRVRPALNTALQQSFAISINPIVSFGWFEALSEPTKPKPSVITAARQFSATSINPLVSFGWFSALSEPTKPKPSVLTAARPFLTTPVNPVVSISWFEPFTDPVRRVGLRPATDSVFLLPIASEVITVDKWVYPWSTPVRLKPGLLPGMQQFLARPDQLPPITASITGVMSALETKDVFLGGAYSWNRVISGEIGVIQLSFTGAEIGVVERKLSAGTSGIIEQAASPASTGPVAAITTGRVSIRIV